MNINNILVSGNYQEEFKSHLSSNLLKDFRFIPVEEITPTDLSWADAYVGPRPSPNFNFSNIKWVHSFNAGVNNYLEIEGWKENNVLLTRTVCSFGQRISEYCLSYILQDLQYHSQFQVKQKQKKWQQMTPKMLRDQTILIFGTGEIGREVAKTFASFGTTVYGVSHSGKPRDYFTEVTTVSNAAILFSKADWIISTLPLTKDTEKLFDRDFFNKLNGTGFINVGRGATVDEEALLHALNTEKVRRAILDVVTTEPLPVNSALWEREDVTITPHISAVTEIDEAIDCFLDTLRKVQNNEILTNKVDFEKGY
ncbi:D-2-hydroxyacid dehydrogenase [Bacillus luteolus]|uniref:D-2-hydroxyacid dehydrogenase n=1 Tax=Litchfieldia luteola TaxID=682179 RepID=A0ABR9QJ49_9BACI|nr:D-2-hydroxyacid dehydrogenase [Cytobacillus luteolus]MBE4908515.1 D-2-hydroxyacid dehydrogenase [Cytobacillus luteolus]MBP1941367.1 phosphoglycerate dehydrogenase-like enzyme [Cytobacillus luteolus]